MITSRKNTCSTSYALNFFNLPLVAYSGEIDKQKQAADIMARYLAQEGMQLSHVIGPNTEHKYHPDSKVEIDKRLNALATQGRDAYPEEIRFTTSTLRYNRMKWLMVDGLVEHWAPARVIALGGGFPYSRSRIPQGPVKRIDSHYGRARLEFTRAGRYPRSKHTAYARSAESRHPPRSHVRGSQRSVWRL